MQTSTGTREFLVNKVSFRPPDIPVLLQILSGASAPSELLPEGSIYLLEANKSVEISMPGSTRAMTFKTLIGPELIS